MLNNVNLNRHIDLDMFITETGIAKDACQRLVKAPLSVTLSLPFFPLSQYPNNPSFIRSFPKGLLHILILGKLHSPSKSFLRPFPKSVFPNKTQW
jgi:hypothetical protein